MTLEGGVGVLCPVSMGEGERLVTGSRRRMCRPFCTHVLAWMRLPAVCAQEGINDRNYGGRSNE